MHHFYIIVTVFSIQFSVLCFPLTMMHLQLAGFQEASLCKEFPRQSSYSCTVWWHLDRPAVRRPGADTVCRNRSKGKHLVFPGARCRQRSPGRFRSTFFALRRPFLSPSAASSGGLPTCVPYSSHPPYLRAEPGQSP